MASDPLRPEIPLLAKIGSIVVHTEEMMSDAGHEVDKRALDALIQDPDVVAWLRAMRLLALIPEKRS